MVLYLCVSDYDVVVVHGVGDVLVKKGTNDTIGKKIKDVLLPHTFD